MDSFNSSFFQSMKGKVIIAFLTGCVAFSLAWAVSRVAFREMLDTVKVISAPNNRLRLVNELYRDITRLDQEQRARAIQKKGTAMSYFLRSSASLRKKIDSLRQLYQNEPAQVQRIDSIQKILQKRDKLFLNYLKVREGLVSGKAFANQLDSLSGLISKSSSEFDSSVITTEKRRSITTVLPDSDSHKREKGFLGRLFGKKKSDDDTTSHAVVKEEINIKIDTLAKGTQEEIIRKMEKAVRDLEKRQRLRSASFVNREIELTNAGNVLINQMLAILQQVERQVIHQTDRNNLEAKDVVSSSVEKISVIMLVFLVVLAVLVYFILSDISSSNAYRRELEAARDDAEYHSMAKQRFLSSMSHEIRTPLQSIIGYSELIRGQDSPRRRDIEAIYNASLHLLHIVNEVLDYSRIISGKFKFEKSTFNINDLLNEVVHAMEQQALNKNLQLRLENNIANLEFIEGDPFRLKQILYNLIGNAIKFTEKGSVTLTAFNESHSRSCELFFKISDTGCGIDPANLARIFDEFEQDEAASSLNAAGTGLGLSIVRALAEGQGGKVSVESQLGRGSTFTVQIACQVARNIAPTRSTVTAVGSNFQGKVWVVDDDSFILQLFSSFFLKHHIEYVSYNTPAAALAAGHDNQVRVILLDMRMPGMNGIQLCRRLRETFSSGVRIYAITAQALPEERESLLGHGFDGLLMKPFREAELLNLLDMSIPTAEETPVVTNQEAVQKVSFTAIEKMAGGDKELIRKILERFIEDSLQDLEDVGVAVQEHKLDQLALLLHRLAGRTGQMGVKDLAAEYRRSELLLRQTKSVTNEEESKILANGSELRLLIHELQATMAVEDKAAQES